MWRWLAGLRQAFSGDARLPPVRYCASLANCREGAAMQRNSSLLMLRCEIPIAIAICNYKSAAFRMGMKRTITSVTIAIGLALVCACPSFAKEKEEEENLNVSNVPAAVQKAANSEAKGGKIVRWEKEGKNYEAVIER